MLNGIHFLLTYSCTSECDHCFLHCGPNAKGTFTVSRLEEALREAARIRTIEWAYFEGGEPFLFYPLLLHGLRLARDLGLKTGVVTNCFWATSEENAVLWLRPLRELGVADLSLSDDTFHHEENEGEAPRFALAAATELKLPISTICIEQPPREDGRTADGMKGAPVTGGMVMYRGRAVEKLTADLPRIPWEKLVECPYEDIENPQRVHVDPYGYVHLCQGLCLGNMWETPLAELVAAYDPVAHPICGPLIRGGPAQLVRDYGVEHQDGYVDECHLCYEARRALRDRLPQWLAPAQVYGITTGA